MLNGKSISFKSLIRKKIKVKKLVNLLSKHDIIFCIIRGLNYQALLIWSVIICEILSLL